MSSQAVRTLVFGLFVASFQAVVARFRMFAASFQALRPLPPSFHRLSVSSFQVADAPQVVRR